MEKEIEAIIREKLPQQVGELLQKRLVQADKLEEQCKILTQSISKQQDTIRKLESTVETYRRFDGRNATLETREKAVTEAEIKQEVQNLKIQLEESNKRADMVKEFTASLVKNTVFKKRIMGTQSEPFTNQYGNRETLCKSQDSTETTTEE